MKALTLSEYVAFIDDYSRDGAKPCHQPAWRWAKTQQYAAFLSQPFDVGMLCNPLTKPEAVKDASNEEQRKWLDNMVSWQAEEDKVIFKGWKKEREYSDEFGSILKWQHESKYALQQGYGFQIHAPKKNGEYQRHYQLFALSTIGNFISDCTRAGIPLEFTDKVAEHLNPFTE